MWLQMGEQPYGLVLPGKLMGLLDIFKRAVGGKSGALKLQTSWKEDGVAIEFASNLSEPTVEALLDSLQDAGPEETIYGAYLAQLAGEGRCSLDSSGVLIPWDHVLRTSELSGASRSRAVPQLTASWPTTADSRVFWHSVRVGL